MWKTLFAKTNYKIGETYNMKGNVMNTDDKLECLRLAIDWCKYINNGNPATIAKDYYNWISEADKPDNLTFEKINQERK